MQPYVTVTVRAGTVFAHYLGMKTKLLFILACVVLGCGKENKSGGESSNGTLIDLPTPPPNAFVIRTISCNEAVFISPGSGSGARDVYVYKRFEYSDNTSQETCSKTHYASFSDPTKIPVPLSFCNFNESNFAAGNCSSF